MEGEALTSFMKNRIGICVLHPVKECADRPVELRQPEGTKYAGSFPELISPHQPFKNIATMKWELEGGTEANLAFSGDIFEAEDHRNWTDCSYKIYGTPLELPFPVAVSKGEKLYQQVNLQVSPSIREEKKPKPESLINKAAERFHFQKQGSAGPKTEKG